MRTLKTKSTGARGELLKADDFVIALVDRLIKTERRLEELQKEVNQHFEMLAEIQPKLTAEGLVTLRAMKADDDAAQEFTVSVQPVKQEPIQ